MALKIGNDLKLYYNTGTIAVPVWTEIKQVGDVTLDLNVGEAEVDLRESTWILNLPAKITVGLNVAFASNPGATIFDALRGFFLNRTSKQFAIASGPIATAGTNYLKCVFFISSFPWAQPTQEMASHDMVLSPGYLEDAGALVEPSWVVV